VQPLPPPALDIADAAAAQQAGQGQLAHVPSL
jgi:hypothetical protein